MLKLAVLLFPAAALLAGCAMPQHRATPAPAAAVAGACDYRSVPAGAVFGTTAQGLEIATYPPVPSDDGCQRVWQGPRDRPAQMEVIATYHYRAGRVQRLDGRVPGGPAYVCHYQGGQLDTRASRGAQHCPPADDLPHRR